MVTPSEILVAAADRIRDLAAAATPPGYGFNGKPSVSVHATWSEARAKLLGAAVGSAGPQWERASVPASLRWGPPRGQIRMGES